MKKVSVSRCDSYDQEKVSAAILQTLFHLGGIANFVKPGQKVLIKPNILMGYAPETATTTHPSIIYAVVKSVVEAGGIALVGDSPGNAHSNLDKTFEITGLTEAAKKAGGEVVHFQAGGVIDVKSQGGNKFKIAKIVKDVDIIINLPKLKTHGLTLYTGAVKNMFGTIPGAYKAMFHASHSHPLDFAGALVDIFEFTKPTLNIMDAVIGMEGSGPSAGAPRKMGAIIASIDAVALDAVCAHLIGYRPKEIGMLAIAYQRKLGEINLAKIELIGEEIENLRQPDWKKPFSLFAKLKWLPKKSLAVLSPIINQIKIWPEIDQSKCKKCLICFNACPVKTIEYDKETKKIWVNRKNCINCFCCHELCEYKAINLKSSWLADLMGLGG